MGNKVTTSIFYVRFVKSYLYSTLPDPLLLVLIVYHFVDVPVQHLSRRQLQMLSNAFIWLLVIWSSIC